MRCLIVLISLLFLILTLATVGTSGDQKAVTQSASASAATVAKETGRVYPIAPGVWYPGQPMPEKPMRYYRVRCWPGCHSGSPYGKYPNRPLHMRPIFPTSTVPVHFADTQKAE